MGTRIWYEIAILNKFEEIRFSRMYYDKTNKVAVAYVADSQGKLSSDLKTSIEEFLNEYGAAHLHHQVKEYSEMVHDRVPHLSDIPSEIRYIALIGELNQRGIMKSLEAAFPFLDMKLANFQNGVLKIWISQGNLSHAETQLIKDYAQELVPISVEVDLI
ncbi:hypothetical protein [Paenibacillus lautus]|uniref:hypothetical protein n=1 Tax=Paenibacillus lautus TaxID=1401 RepID=UPI001C7CD005|nr:hypothetical protein [Paenibacillus lautus]MBX4152398.1 hypothetical protein [Paenibacillus lautus]